MLPWNEYETLAYDLDGTLTHSNELKGAGFHRAVETVYGHEAGQAMEQIHKTAGSVSRLERVRMFVRDYLKLNPDEHYGLVLRLDANITYVVGVTTKMAPLIDGVVDHLRMVRDVRKVIVTGAAHDEAEEALKRHCLLPFFESINASARKPQTLPALVDAGIIKLPAVYFGDTREDMDSALAAGMDVVLITDDAMEEVNTDDLDEEAKNRVKIVQNFTEL